MLYITGNAPPHFSITVPPPTGSRVHAVDLAPIAETGSIYPLAPGVSDPNSNEYLFESSTSIAEGAALGFHLQKFAVGLPPGSYSPEDRIQFHGFPSASPLLAFFSCQDSGHVSTPLMGWGGCRFNVEMVDVPGPRVVPDERKARATSISSSAPSSSSAVEMVDAYPPHVFSGGSKVPENPAVILFIFPPAIAETGSVHPFIPSASDPDSNEWLFESSASIAEGAALGVVCWSPLYSPERFMAFTNLESKPRKPQWCPTRARKQRMSFSIATASSASVGRSCTANPAGSGPLPQWSIPMHSDPEGPLHALHCLPRSLCLYPLDSHAAYMICRQFETPRWVNTVHQMSRCSAPSDVNKAERGC
ncbi:hypothetical protein B0H16DRAFT_1744399 [Mycena metata]|uniref:Uncharacterized protein n=1 Tax=Mycena metata TaxID=1033252 RepID=A0AAD7H4R6_9AGAR|nr:hypothetical protein B0H16DRAFT_1744399 [Mycena metata]